MDFEGKVYEFMGEMRTEIKAVKSDLEDIKEGVSDYRKLKNRLIGAALIVSTTTGAAIQAFWKKLTDT